MLAFPFLLSCVLLVLLALCCPWMSRQLAVDVCRLAVSSSWFRRWLMFMSSAVRLFARACVLAWLRGPWPMIRSRDLPYARDFRMLGTSVCGGRGRFRWCTGGHACESTMDIDGMYADARMAWEFGHVRLRLRAFGILLLALRSSCVRPSASCFWLCAFGFALCLHLRHLHMHRELLRWHLLSRSCDLWSWLRDSV